MYTSKRVIRPNNEVVRYYCDNGYGLSVACHEHSYGGKEGLYEIALLKGDHKHQETPQLEMDLLSIQLVELVRRWYVTLTE